MSKESKAIGYANRYAERDWQIVSKDAYLHGWDEALRSQWIKVEDKLPELYKNVLALIKYKSYYQIHYTSRYTDNKEWIFAGSPVIAWMPIPSFDDIIEANKNILKRLKDK